MRACVPVYLYLCVYFLVVTAVHRANRNVTQRPHGTHIHILHHYLQSGLTNIRIIEQIREV